MILAVRDRVSGPETVFACDLRVSTRVQFAATSGYLQVHLARALLWQLVCFNIEFCTSYRTRWQIVAD